MQLPQFWILKTLKVQSENSAFHQTCINNFVSFYGSAHQEKEFKKQFCCLFKKKIPANYKLRKRKSALIPPMIFLKQLWVLQMFISFEDKDNFNTAILNNLTTAVCQLKKEEASLY